MELDELCHNLTLSRLMTNGTNVADNVTAPQAVIGPPVMPQQAMTSSPTDDVSLVSLLFGSGNNSANVTLEEEIEEFLLTFEFFAEWYAIPTVASIGIVLNILLMCILRYDMVLRRMSLVLHELFIAAELLYLVSVFLFVQFRFYFRHSERHLWAMSGVTAALAVLQLLPSYCLYILAIDSYRAARMFEKPAKVLTLIRVRSHIAWVLVGCLVFSVPYIPDIRLLLHKLHPEGFDPCNLPVEDHWRMIPSHGQSFDLYYILFYTAFYIFITFVLPLILIGTRDKDILDVLQSVRESEVKVPSACIHACNTAGVVSVMCNIYLVCLIPKFILLMFQTINVALDFIGNAQVYFEFFNTLANVLMVGKSCCHLVAFLVFSHRARVIVWLATCGKSPCCRWMARGASRIKSAFLRWRKSDED